VVTETQKTQIRNHCSSLKLLFREGIVWGREKDKNLFVQHKNLFRSEYLDKDFTLVAQERVLLGLDELDSAERWIGNNELKTKNWAFFMTYWEVNQVFPGKIYIRKRFEDNIRNLDLFNDICQYNNLVYSDLREIRSLRLKFKICSRKYNITGNRVRQIFRRCCRLMKLPNRVKVWAVNPNEKMLFIKLEGS